MKLLACPKCHQQLHLENKTLKCENNHCYDISKRGYINLLLNPDKATNNPGDSKESLVARKAYLNKGYYDMLDFERENTDNIFKEEVFDGNQLVVSNISNVTVVGDNSTLLVNPRYANVICFRECSNIKLIGLTLGHTPKGKLYGICLAV